MAFLQAGRGEGPFWGDGRQAMLNVPPVVLWLIAALAVTHALRVFLPPSIGNAVLHLFAFVPQHIAQIRGLGWTGLAAVSSFLAHMFLHLDATGVAVECLLLLAFGSVVARRFGAWRFLAIFACGGIAGALLYMATAWNSPAGIMDAGGGVAAVMLTAIRATWMRQVRPTTHPPELAGVLSPQVLVTIVLWTGLSFIFPTPVILPTGVGTALIWQQSLAGMAVGLALSELFDRLMPKIDLAGR
jgi:membrane associated rhomboid family serine protease